MDATNEEDCDARRFEANLQVYFKTWGRYHKFINGRFSLFGKVDEKEDQYPGRWKLHKTRNDSESNDRQMDESIHESGLRS